MKWNCNMLTCPRVQVDHMTKLMLEGGRDESEDKENHRKENRRETWAPGLAGTSSRHAHASNICAYHCCLLQPCYRFLHQNLGPSIQLLTHRSWLTSCKHYNQRGGICTLASVYRALCTTTGCWLRMQGSVIGKGHFRPRLEAALWQKRQSQRRQRGASLNQRLCLLLPWD